MKKIFSIAMVALSAIVLLGSCAREQLDTDQYVQDVVALNVYGPQPVVRGGELRFLGSNLDKVTSIEIPGVPAITDITVVKAGVPSEIRITVPKDGPEPGYVVLTASDGTKITTTTQISYSEPITIEAFTPATVLPGETITITGDYLNLIHEVIFTQGVIVSEKDFAAHDRYTIKVTVPEEAQTGVIGLGTIDETVLGEMDEAAAEALLKSLNIVETEEELTVKTAAGKVGKDTYKAGETVTISGTDLNLVKAVLLEGATVSEFTVSGGKLSFVLPATVTDGEVSLEMASGVTVPVGSITTVVPTGLATAPSPVKNGAELTITGKDLDLVTGVDLPNAAGVEFTNEGQIVLTVPEAAQAGDAVLHLENGKTATVAYTLVEPTVTAFSENPASAGSAITVNGTDLDLVQSVTFGGGITVDVETGADAFSVAVPTAAETGVFVLNLKNGTSIETIELAIDKPSGAYIPVMPGTLYSPGEMFIVELANGEKLTDVQFDGESVTFICNNNTLYVQIPATAKASTTITLASSDGSAVTYPMNIDPGDFIVTPIWTGSFTCQDWNGDQSLAWGAFDWSSVPVGRILRFEMEPTVPEGSWWCISLRHGTSWGALAGVPGQYDTPGATLDVELTKDILDDLVANNGLVVTGTGFVLKSISLVEDLRFGTTIWTGPFTCQDWNGDQGLAWGAFDWSAVKPGQILFFHMTPTVEAGSWWCISLRHGTNWGALAGVPGQYDSPESPMAVTLTQEILDDLVANSGLVVTGTGYILEKISLK